MRIKQLRLKGFKSFADKTVIDFNENFIAVVGPNGSGKSNIIDAVRWVFGEHSNKSLRGNSSTDVIFGGTEKRAKQNIAEVTIVLDNTDQHLNIEYDEVAITRRLYRTGSSEYFINKNECRLKDIIDLTLDKGIGKSAFSIISQGKIEEIITVNPEARRSVVEEVAGILKYKKRKENTLKKIKMTNENLSQVDLILNEMNDRLIPLENQAQKAKKFKEYKTILTTHEKDLLANKIHIGRLEFDSLDDIIKEKKVELIKFETDDTNNELEIQKLIEKTREKSIEINSLNSKIMILNNEIQKNKSDYKILLERRQFNENSNQRQIYLENQIYNLKEEIVNVETQASKLKPKVENTNNEKENLNNEINQLRSNIYKTNQRISDLETELSRQTIPFATRKVIESNISGITGIVSSLFKTELKYSEAIAIALGSRVNDIVVEKKYDGQKAIDFLKSNKFGRQTFLPKDSMRSTYIDSKVLNDLQGYEGFVDIAINLVTFNANDSKPFENMLGNVIIAQNLSSAMYISKNITSKYRIVTLEGEVIATTGAMSGGQNKKRNKIIIENELENERKKLLKISTQIEGLNQKYQKLIELSNKDNIQYQLYVTTVSKYNADLKLLEAELFEIKGSSKDEKSTDEIQKKIDELNNDLEEINIEKTKLEIENDNDNEKLEELRHHQREISESFKILSVEVNKYEIQKSKLEVDIKNSLEILSSDYSESFEESYSKAKKSIDLDKYSEIVSEYKKKIRNLGPVNILAIEEYEEIKTRYEFIDEQKNDLLQAKEKLEGIIEKLDVFFIESFSETYKRLREEFQNIYCELFGGGQADLVLTKPDDMLETGVEIVAQPPGKKLQTISLLSGGEKALTAISLLFAILRIKKLPFAILDEVEAALDEVNVKRYAKYIKVFSERTQFIVITHRQGTMETVDALYGITMQEKGVSTVVKVKLNEGEDNV